MVRDPTRRRAIERAIEQAESVSARQLTRLYLDRLRAALGSLDMADYVELVDELRDERDEGGARAVQELRFPPHGDAA